ncbi:tRNA (adenosine(37)-N6)-threonylcarbamoyltransferase complex dimerization subunit type 1 TsaB [Hwanghaeella grinnelliae]|uniref:tRNA (Adenosine(37)-N6)-threonylcarbamoyltransferase complex dimerization subunit type 1 TsaB n=1 Tax=Hwanghaeella grinnelliae TaxID=2500179 RepID=A0A437QP41_9PROT|nr:tRNA (adenosine(37)-N6)-threonylcarbamoyltransferase complex dimerization subunit type 1 TsaB [Hwanghaeella grinnelliae]RVU36308.1 tRNA (adenosine(37)-N6)-threonylcarbamoyltransferase complex dimerization subunit type 1 TsaB [Hwanghaeella grinnelliae]
MGRCPCHDMPGITKQESDQMRLLVLDCAANACAVAVLDNDLELASVSEPMTRGHAERIAPMLAECLATAATDADCLDAVAVTIGPGAFTGIRIGLAAARGFSLAAGIPILGVSCLAVAASPFRGQSPVLVALETKRADFYLQAFDRHGDPATDPAALSAGDIATYLPAYSAISGPALDGIPDGWPVAGDGADRLVSEALDASPGLHVANPPETNSAVTAGRIAMLQIARKGLPDPTDTGPRPLYLRPPDVNLKPAVSPLTAAPPPRSDA